MFFFFSFIHGWTCGVLEAKPMRAWNWIFSLCHTACRDYTRHRHVKTGLNYKQTMWCTAIDMVRCFLCHLTVSSLCFSVGEWVWQTSNAVHSHCYSIRQWLLRRCLNSEHSFFPVLTHTCICLDMFTCKKICKKMSLNETLVFDPDLKIIISLWSLPVSVSILQKLAFLSCKHLFNVIITLKWK